MITKQLYVAEYSHFLLMSRTDQDKNTVDSDQEAEGDLLAINKPFVLCFLELTDFYPRHLLYLV